MIFDFIDGAAGSETAPDRNLRALEQLHLQSRVLLDVSSRSLTRTFLGDSFDLPFGIAPMGMCRLSHPRADRFLAAASRARNIPICLSSAASMTIEDMYRHAGRNAWFQLYAAASDDQTMSFVSRAARAGYRTLVLTVDVPQVSRRVRDLRNGFQVPFRLGPRQMLDFALHPRWSLTTLWHGVPRPVNYDMDGGAGFDRDGARAAADWGFLDRLRRAWHGHLIVKGVTSPEDARRIREAGADAVWVSNHGGRQLDSAPAASNVLPRIRAAVGPGYPLVFDSGIRSGEDVVKALALGADFVMLGRPLLFALGAAGRTGLNDLLDELTEHISVTMAQIGVCSLDQVSHRCLVDAPAELAAVSGDAVNTVRMVETQRG